MTLTPEVSARRVAIALDVLDQIRLERLRPTGGTYFDLDDADDDLLEKIEEACESGLDLQSVVDLVTPHCAVCAKGALVLSMARCFDSVPLGQVINWHGGSRLNGDVIQVLLGDTFDPFTLDAIEAAFETIPIRGAVADMMPYCAFGLAAGRFYQAHAALRLIAVMNNLVANGGVFDPTQTPDTTLPEK